MTRIVQALAIVALLFVAAPARAEGRCWPETSRPCGGPIGTDVNDPDAWVRAHERAAPPPAPRVVYVYVVERHARPSTWRHEHRSHYRPRHWGHERRRWWR